MIEQLKNIDKILNNAFTESKKSKKIVLLKYTIKINQKINIIKDNLLRDDNMIYMNLPGNKAIYIGAGNRTQINQHKNDINKQYKVLSNSHKDDITTMGISAFDLDRETNFPWTGIKREYFIIPEVLLIIDKTNTLNFNLIINKDLCKNGIKQKLEKTLINLLKNNKTKNNTTVHSISKKIIPNKKSYLDIFNSMIKTIKNNEIKKIVLSKIESHTIKNKINLIKTCSIMERDYKNCFNFIIKLNKEDFFLGSTPESIISVQKKAVTTVALAGTSKTKNDLNKFKEITEHEYVIKHLMKTLKKYGKDIKQHKTNKLKLNYAYHLKTKISTTLKKKKHILEILSNIYPTPALSGYPKDKAINEIKKSEPFDRGFYGGAIGLYNNIGEGNFFASIRSALIRKNKIYFFSGGGITKDSEYLKEWEETEIKLKHIKSIIDLK